MTSRPSVPVTAISAALLALVATGCAGIVESTEPAATGSDGRTTVTSTDDSCELSGASLPAGPHVFALTNDGSQVTEVYVYAGDTILSEKEDIAPGTAYDLTVELEPGQHAILCRPGMRGDGIRQAVSVTASGARTADPAAQRAVAAYRAWVQEQADALVPLTQRFAAAVTAGDIGAAKRLYAPSRVPWERIEPVAESFGDLDPRVDLREADLEPGQRWTGWHRLEKALWQEGSTTGMAPVAAQLVADVRELQRRVPTAPMSVTSIGNGAKELLDEVASGKVTGEEEAFSHTDLVDFAANVDGAQQALEVLRPLVAAGDDPQLLPTLDRAFADVRAALRRYERGEGTYVSYDTVPEPERRELARVVDALSEPLSRLTAAAVS